MKCPLSFRLTTDEKSLVKIESVDCIKEECALWDEYVESCGVLMIAFRLQYIVDVLAMIQTELCLSKYTFRCRDCGLTITWSVSEGAALPADWTRTEQIDGKYIMLCDVCSNLEK